MWSWVRVREDDEVRVGGSVSFFELCEEEGSEEDDDLDDDDFESDDERDDDGTITDPFAVASDVLFCWALDVIVTFGFPLGREWDLLLEEGMMNQYTS